MDRCWEGLYTCTCTSSVTTKVVLMCLIFPFSLLPAGEGEGECGELVGSGGGVHDGLPKEAHQGCHCGL